MTSCSRRVKALFLVILLIGALTRLSVFFLAPVFIDEGIQYATTSGSLSNMLSFLLYQDPHLPLYNLLTFLINRFTTSLQMMRLPSLLAGITSVYLAFRLGKCLFSDACALVLAALTAVSYTTWIADSEARCYGLLIANLMWCLLLLFERFATSDNEKAGKTAPRFLFWLAFFLLANWHYLGTVLSGACALACLLHRHKGYLKDILLIASGWIIPVGWFIYSRLVGHNVMMSGSAGAGPNYAEGLGSKILQVPCYLLDLDVFRLVYSHWLQQRGGEEFWEKASLLLQNWSPALGLLILLAALAGWFNLRKTQRAQADTLLICLLMPWLALAAGSYAGVAPFQCRHLACVCLCLLMLLAGLTSPQSPSLQQEDSATTPDSEPPLKRPGVLGPSLLACAGLIILLNLPLIALFPSTPYIQRNSWQGALDFIESHKTPQSLIGIHIKLAVLPFSYVYDKEHIRFDFTNPQTFKMYAEPGYQGMNIIPIADAIRNPQLGQYVTSQPVLAVLLEDGVGSSVMYWLLQNFVVQDSYRLDNMYNWNTLQVLSLLPKKRPVPEIQPEPTAHKE